MRIDVIYVLRIHPRIPQSQLHAAHRTLVPRRRSGHVKCIAALPESHHSARIVAPLARAEDNSSSTTMPHPSPMTKPSRSLSKGRLARAGSSFLIGESTAWR